MSSIDIRKISITDLDTDAIVNAANDGLRPGTGVCGYIFDAAGYNLLNEACKEIGHCDTGSAVITPGFNSKAKYIIHAVGPVWCGGDHNEPQLLYSAYHKALELARENGCRTIGFPLLSTGVFGYPKPEAWKVAIKSCTDFLNENEDYPIDIIFAVLDDEILAMGIEALHDIDSADSDKSDGYQKSSRRKFDNLTISGKKHDAIFFHLPNEPFGFLSNWYLASFDLEGIHFTSTEQYIMYKKCLIFGDVDAAKEVLATNDTAEQQKIGRNAKGYNGFVWSGMRQMIAFRGLMAKFEQNDDLRQKLIDTDDAILVECAGSDKVWACGIKLDDDMRFDSANWSGENILGFALMEVRSLLK